jgi:hypothetical protein
MKCSTAVTLTSLLFATALLCSCNQNRNAAPQKAPSASNQQPSSQSVNDASFRGDAGSVTEELCLLAATPAEDWGYPATLFRVADGKLQPVRQVLPETEKSDFVEAWGNAIFLMHGSWVTVIHTDEPLRPDDVYIEPSRDQVAAAYADQSEPLFINPYELLLAQPHTPAVDALLASSRHDIVNLLIVSSDPSSSPRVRLNDWNEYKGLRRTGAVGGPDSSFTPAGSQVIFGEVIDGSLTIHNSFAQQTIEIVPLPAAVLDALNRVARPTWMKSPRAIILAATEQFLLFKPEYTAEERASPQQMNSAQMDLYLQDRVRNVWSTIHTEGNWSRFRMFGPWLSTIVGMWNPQRTASPGHENERGPKALGNSEMAGSKGNAGHARFPCVQCLYEEEVLHPGVLVLQNLVDGRRIRIETGQEDSEILAVRDQNVLYRVNDTIYQASMQGDQLQNASTIAKDRDVPEVHWVFWSANPTLAAAPPIRLSNYGPTKRIQVDGEVQAQLLIHQVPPVIPERARQIRGLGGTVEMRAIIDKDGSAKPGPLIPNNNPYLAILAGPALEAVRQWRYSPTLVDGDAVEVETTITVTFPSAAQ